MSKTSKQTNKQKHLIVRSWWLQSALCFMSCEVVFRIVFTYFFWWLWHCSVFGDKFARRGRISFSITKAPYDCWVGIIAMQMSYTPVSCRNILHCNKILLQIYLFWCSSNSQNMGKYNLKLTYHLRFIYVIKSLNAKVSSEENLNLCQITQFQLQDQSMYFDVFLIQNIFQRWLVIGFWLLWRPNMDLNMTIS